MKSIPKTMRKFFSIVSVASLLHGSSSLLPFCHHSICLATPRSITTISKWMMMPVVLSLVTARVMVHATPTETTQPTSTTTATAADDASSLISNREPVDGGGTTQETSASGDVAPPAKVRVVTEEELASKNGVDGGDIWISIMGEVYNVTSGRQYYGPGSGYSIFAGRDGSVPFVTGTFTEEEAQKGLEVLSGVQLRQLHQWKGFYRKEGKYPFIGYLQGKYFDEHGKPTKALKLARKRIKKAIAEKNARASAGGGVGKNDGTFSKTGQTRATHTEEEEAIISSDGETIVSTETE